MPKDVPRAIEECVTTMRENSGVMTAELAGFDCISWAMVEQVSWDVRKGDWVLGEK